MAALTVRPDTRPTWEAGDGRTPAEYERFQREGMTAAEIREELRQAFTEADHHGIDCTCCEPAGETAQSRYEIDSEVRYALDRFGPKPDYGLTTLERLEEIAQQAVEDGLAAAREAIIARAVAGLASDVLTAGAQRAPRPRQNGSGREEGPAAA